MWGSKHQESLETRACCAVAAPRPRRRTLRVNKRLAAWERRRERRENGTLPPEAQRGATRADIYITGIVTGRKQTHIAVRTQRRQEVFLPTRSGFLGQEKAHSDSAWPRGPHLRMRRLIRVILANAADMQNRRGHKTDSNDSRWLAHL